MKIFDVPVENHILLFTPANSETFNVIYENYKSAAVEFRGKVCNAESCFANTNARRSTEKTLTNVTGKSTLLSVHLLSLPNNLKTVSVTVL